MKFVSALFARKMDTIKEFLLKRNEVILSPYNVPRKLILMDATGSMSGLMDKAKNTVHLMFVRVYKILDEKNTKEQHSKSNLPYIGTMTVKLKSF